MAREDLARDSDLDWRSSLHGIVPVPAGAQTPTRTSADARSSSGPAGFTGHTGSTGRTGSTGSTRHEIDAQSEDDSEIVAVAGGRHGS